MAENDGTDGSGLSRRGMVGLGAAGASYLVTIRPAIAATAASALNCQISVPDPARSGQYVAADGTLVAPDTPGAFPPAPRPLTGDEVRTMLAGGTPPGLDYDRARAYTNYVRRLQRGTSGFTCFASLQSPRG